MNTRINKLLHRTPEVEEFIAPLRTSVAPQVRLSQFQIGIDNQHIDVALSHKFRNVLDGLTDMIVHEDLVKHGWARMGKSPSNADFDALRDVYREMMRGTLEQVHENASLKDLLQLLHLALLKMLLEAPAEAIARLRNKLQQDADSPAGQNSGRSLELHERMANLARHEPGIRYRALRRIFKVIMRLESKELRKLRKSVVGRSWSVPKQVLFNPLLHLPDLSSEEFIMNHYPLLCVDRSDGNYFDLTNRIVTEVFQNYLPIWTKAPERQEHRAGDSGNQPFKIRNRELHSGFSEFLEGQRLLERCLSEEEFKSLNVSWLDTPTNIDVLIRQTHEESGWFSRGSAPVESSPWRNPDCDKLQEKLQAEIHRRFDKAGITRRAIAAYRTPRLFRQLNGRVPLKDVYLYLAEQIPKKAISKRLATTPDKGVAVIKALDVVLNYIRRMPVSKQQEYATRYLKDFATFRRDLKLAYYTYQQMSRLRIQQAAESIKLSRDNGALYEFRLGRDQDDDTQKIKAHAVLKADVRGSTEITRQLLGKRLNPATHFSMNFFGPITKLLERFGALKVFVEGDALILAVLETGGVSTQAMTVANACGLARKILSVMESQNSQNRACDLPKLELGLGIAFCNDAPAYLYDEQRRIMISPAINQADRLSSCAGELRKNTAWRRSRRHRVEVMRSGSESEGKGGLLRYNVNGIDLDPPAFAKLKSEMVLHKIRLHSRSGEAHHYHVGRFMDRLGSAHWLVVREAKIKRWEEGTLVNLPEGEDDTFYEVITDTELVGRVKEKLNGRKNSKDADTEATDFA